MKGVVNPLRQLGVDAIHAGDILDAGPRELFQAAKLPEQSLPALGTDAGNAFEGGRRAGPGPALAMASDGEAMGFVAYLLHQMQGG